MATAPDTRCVMQPERTAEDDAVRPYWLYGRPQLQIAAYLDGDLDPHVWAEMSPATQAEARQLLADKYKRRAAESSAT